MDDEGGTLWTLRVALLLVLILGGRKREDGAKLLQCVLDGNWMSHENIGGGLGMDQGGKGIFWHLCDFGYAVPEDCDDTHW